MKFMIIAILLFTLFPAGESLSEEQTSFPQPESLKSEIQFWKQVYSSINSDEGYIHDDRHLSIIYMTLQFPEGASYLSQRRLIKKKVAYISGVLARLGRGNWRHLNSEEQRILKLWPDNTSAATFAKASKAVRFQRGQADKFVAGLRREGQWREYIKQVFHSMSLPEELERLPHVESSFNAYARSYVGASGLWQFTRSTGRRYMRVDHVVDERLDPYHATKAAAQLLKHNYSVTGSWPLALTAYNHGVAGMRRASEKLKTKNMTKIIREYKGRTFGFASRNFYVSFLAAIELSDHPEKYFTNYQPLPALEYIEIEVPDYMVPQKVADVLGVTLDKLREDNPSLQASIWKGTKYLPKHFKLKLFGEFDKQQLQAKINAIPEAHRYAKQKPDRYYKIRKGDSLSRIAKRFKTSVSDLLALNQLRSAHRIRAGKTLRLPVKGETDELIAVAKQEDKKEKPVEKVDEVKVAAVSNMPVPAPTIESTKVFIDREVIKPAALSADPSDYSVNEKQQIIVQDNETLGHYADWLGISSSTLRRINHMRFGKPVIVGRKLKLSFNKVKIETFEKVRTEFHRELQAAYFAKNKLNGECAYSLKTGDSLWLIAMRKFKVPAWLVRQFNPDVDFNRSLSPGDKIIIPKIEGNDLLLSKANCV